jgi:hypothetical protein
MALAAGLREHEIASLEIGDVFEADGGTKKRIGLRVFKRSSGAQTQQEVIVPADLRAKLENSGVESVGAGSNSRGSTAT